MRIIANNIVKLLSSTNDMQRTFIVIIGIIVKKIDNRTKKEKKASCPIASREYLILYLMTIMTIILQLTMILIDNNLTIERQYDNNSIEVV